MFTKIYYKVIILFFFPKMFTEHLSKAWCQALWLNSSIYGRQDPCLPGAYIPLREMEKKNTNFLKSKIGSI